MDSTLQAFLNMLEQSIGMDVTTPAFWIAVAQIIAIDILLGGDNAVVIALAPRRLPEQQRRKAIFWGICGAVAIRVILIFFALQMLRIPLLKIAGGVLLFWIGVKLLPPQHADDGREIDASTHLLGAIRTIVVADAVMSIDRRPSGIRDRRTGYNPRVPLLLPMGLGAVSSVAIPVITFVLMAIVGSDLRGEDFQRLLRRSQLVWAGWLVPPLVLPPLAVGLIVLLRPPGAIAMGLLLVASCPVGGISNAFTYLAAGTTTLSVLLTALSCLTAVVTMPTIGAVLGVVGHEAVAAAPPVPALFAPLLLAVAVPVPVSLGLVARTRWPAATERLRPAAWRLAVALLALLIALVILNEVPAFLASLPDAVPLAVCFIAASLAIGAGVARTLRANWPDGVALAIEFPTRNVAVATMGAVTVMGRIEFAIFGTAYFLTEVPLMVAAAVALRAVARRRAREGGGLAQ